jgi:predicted Zn-dependent peptidase
MRQLDFSPRSLAVQQSVVTEEYNYRYMNQPYGDVWLLLRPLCYKVHPYRWCTIGADIRHVQEATLADVESFFNRYYCPDNAIIAVVGNVKCDEVVRLVEKMYGDIPSGSVRHDSLPVEPPQTEARELEVKREVPANALYMAYPMCGRLDEGFAACDLISDMLSNGRSSRLYNSLVKSKALFSEVDAYITGDRDPGLFVVSGRLNDGVGFDAASVAVSDELREIAEGRFDEMELEKVKNKYENTFVYSQYKAIDCAMSLCYYEWLGHAEWVNEEPALYREVSKEAVRRMAERMFKPEQLSMLRIMK